MNNWMDTVPCHRRSTGFTCYYGFNNHALHSRYIVRWNPDCEDTVFFKQSAALHATYYQLQIFIHRPFIPAPRNPSPATFPSLAICSNAARSCSHVLESFNRRGSLPYVSLQVLSISILRYPSRSWLAAFSADRVYSCCHFAPEYMEWKKVRICSKSPQGNARCSTLYRSFESCGEKVSLPCIIFIRDLN